MPSFVEPGVLTIPNQTWISEQNQEKPTGSIVPQDQETEEDHESVVIRRIGFVFLAYNIEYW